MLAEVIMPKLDLSMEEGTILCWKKSVGDYVGKGETLVEVEADKANVDLQSEHNGILKQIVVESDTTAKVGEVIGYIETEVTGKVKAQ